MAKARRSVGEGLVGLKVLARRCSAIFLVVEERNRLGPGGGEQYG